MKTVAVTPIIGEFGYLIFDIQPRVRAWLRQQQAERKIVFAPKESAVLFEEATEIIDLPRELLPTAPATMRSIVYEHWLEGDPQRVKIEKLVEWARSTISADAWLEIPYFQSGPWMESATFAPLASELEPPSEPYIALAARAREFDAWRNWPKASWDELVRRILEKWKLQVRCVGRPPSTYFPAGAIAQEVDEPNRLDDSIRLFNHAVCSISSNSGPTHLSLMANCPTFAWGEPYLKQFMERHTNPLGTPCYFYPGGWDPDVDSVWKFLCQWRVTMESRGLWKGRSSPPTRLSMCMIARDSSRTIEAALKTIQPWVDEMVVVDTGSLDNTPTIAEACGARVFHSPWQDSFSAARNESVRHARGDWVFWMDSDDTIDKENGRKLKEHVAAKHSPSTMGFVLQVQCPGAISPESYSTATVVDHVKLFRRVPAIAFTGRIHEQVLPAIRALGGGVEWTDLHVVHSGSDQSPDGRKRKQARDLRLLELELAEDPDNTFTLFNVGMTLVDMARPGDALDALSRSLQLAESGDSHIRKIYALLVQAYSELKRPETALRTCKKGLAVCPADPELLFRKGVLEQSLGQLDQAEASFKFIVQRAQERHFSSIDTGILGVKAWHNLAVLYERRDMFSEACFAWSRVLECDRSNKLAWRGFLDNLTRVKDADGLAKIANSDPSFGVPFELRCIAKARWLVQGRSPRAAVRGLQEAMQKDNSLDLLEELCQIAFSSNLLDLAESGLCELVRRRPEDPASLQNLSVVYLRRHNYSKAGEAAKRSLALRPNYPPAQQALDLATRSAAMAVEASASEFSAAAAVESKTYEDNTATNCPREGVSIAS